MFRLPSTPELGVRTFYLVVAILVPSSALADGAPEWRWRQLLSIPSVGGRLRAIEVDPRNPDIVFIGTEQGTVLRSDDRGVTWRELEVNPFVVQDRSLGLSAPGLPQLGTVTPNNFKQYVDPPWKKFVDRIEIDSAGGLIFLGPHFLYVGFVVTAPLSPAGLLDNVTRSRSNETQPIRRIVVCPGANEYPLLVTTSRDLFGSFDDGLTYVRIFANAGRLQIYNVVCSPNDPNYIAVSTGIGLFTSRDGGLTFDQDLTAWPGQPSTAVAFGPSKEGARLYSAASADLFAGDPESPEGMSPIYPTDPKTAPWRPIWWIDTTDDGEVWLATDDGVRVSYDEGEDWHTVARTLLNRQSVWQVTAGENESGSKRVAAMINHRPTSMRGNYVSGLHNSMIYSSDDGGKTWHPFFHGVSRRTFHQMAAVRSSESSEASWWVVTSGEVWTTAPPVRREPPIDEESADWARKKFRHTPSLISVMDQVLDNTGLSNEKIASLNERHRNLNWLPRLDLQLQYKDRLEDAEGSMMGDTGNNQTVTRGIDQADVRFLVQIAWDIKDVLILKEDLGPTRTPLHELRRQIAFATEDAWHERLMHLRTIAGGLSDPVQIGTLRTRIEALEVMLNIWLGMSLDEVGGTL